MKLLIFVSLTVFSIICFYLVLRRKKYTRERFAFFSTFLMFSFAISVLTHLFMDISYIHIVIYVVNQLFSIEIPIPLTSWSDKLWSVVILLLLFMFVRMIYDTWYMEGAISKKDQDLRNKRKPLSFSRAIVDGASIKILAEPASIESQKTNDQYELLHLDEVFDWHSEVKNLLSMSSHQYNIFSNDWYSEESSYLSQYSNQPILIYCVQTCPDLVEIKRKIKCFTALGTRRITRVIVASKDSHGIKKKVAFEGCTIEFKCKKDMLDSLVNFDDYFERLKFEFCSAEITEGDKISLQDIYVESCADIVNLKDAKNTQKVEYLEKYLLDWARDDSHQKHISILGEYGQGKSVLSLKIALDIIDSNCDRIPIIIELRGKSPRNETVATIIASWALRFDINVKAIQTLLQEGRLIIILEGFDELDMVGNAYRRLEHFKKLWEFAMYRKSKVIITGRPNLFLDNQEAREYLHLNNKGSELFQVEAIHLRPFIRPQIEKALRSVSEIVRSEILALFDSCEEGKGFRDLISRPSTLYQTSVIWEILDKSNINSASVIDEFINHAYRRQAEKLRSLGPTGMEPLVLTAMEREYFMLGIAVGMIKKNGYSNQISQTSLREIVAGLYFDIPNKVSNDHATSIPLRFRLKDDPDALESVFNDVRTAGIVVRDLTGINTFKFAHKSFLELLFAKYFVGLISHNDDEVIYNSIAIALNIEGDVFRLQFSDEVISHIAELLVSNIVEEERNDSIAVALIKNINPKLKIIDLIFFRRFCGVTIVSSTICFLLSIMAFIFMKFIIIKPSFDMIGLIGLSIFIFFILLLTITEQRLNIVKKYNASFEIWKIACEKLNVNPENPPVFSRQLMNFLYERHNKFQIIIINVLRRRKKIEDTLLLDLLRKILHN